MLKPLTDKLLGGGNLDSLDIATACQALLDADSEITTRADFLRALGIRGITEHDLSCFASELLQRAEPFPADGRGAIDVCGTGGDKAGLFNVSTAVMFVAAGAGARVIKHGNRGITSKSGGADVLEMLGMRIDLSPSKSAELLQDTGCCFLFAPLYHPAVKAIAPVRQALAREGIPTIFNLLGPLINPAKPDFQMVGIYDGSIVETYAKALQSLGRTRAWVVHGTGEIRLDELSTLGSSDVVESSPEGIKSFEVDPAQHGFAPPDPKNLQGGTPEENAKILEDILNGSDSGPKRDIVVLNAAAALTVCGIAQTMEEGLLLAGESLDSGAANKKLSDVRTFSQNVSPNTTAS